MAKNDLFEHETKKEFNFFMAIIPLAVMVITMLYAIVVLETDPHLPLIIGTVTAAVVAFINGFKFDDLEEMMYKGIRLALPAVVIIMLVGLIIGSWIGGGVVATMIYYGLMIINPQYFLVTICLICGIVSLAIGSSWSTMATIGVAGMGIGVSMGINPAMIAGAVISGAYFGDKMSPLSDTTNLASGLTNTDLFVHIKHMLYTTVPGLIVALTVFFFIGINVIGTNTASPEDIQVMLASMDENFVISPWLLAVPVLVILCIIMKVKAVPALAVGVFLGFICSILVQGETLADSASFLMNGFVLESNNEMVDTLFNRGGLMDMMYTISMTIVAMTFAGILEYTGMLSAIMNQILKIAKGTFGIISATIVSCFATNATCSEQYISVVVPSRMFLRTYIENRLHSKNLSRSLEDGGTLTSVFIPWNTCGVFIYGTLGVSALEYAPFAILNFTVPVIALILAATGFGIAKITAEERDAYLAEYYPDEQQEKPATA
ncbi:Na(+)/H(+) antiporter NhaC [Jeotgalicoccus saudimassiliensis]|uniref:Na(+)/H(+) antiporter NhaC n=1 Tax=Jeotgalicoccus saudimassiliensis TaxID=1461582 RepID=A0A078MCC1_9STAP|nr:Na+/H+ antiporter NhaC [Jeotgalicoccus saudimassiliensis]CEA02371.1 Na(+)/H(+) antiporter NhaC [Jeotgalicoccus saudimassiliensis]